jgi:hypothetical protein
MSGYVYWQPSQRDWLSYRVTIYAPIIIHDGSFWTYVVLPWR